MRLSSPLAALALLLALLVAGCEGEEGSGGGGGVDGGGGGANGGGGLAASGADRSFSERCIAVCHEPIGVSLASVPSHALLYDCSACHAPTGLLAGPGHETSVPCASCHSARSHPPSARCAFCHDPHGTPNLWSLRETLHTPAGVTLAVSVHEAGGAVPEGLVHRGVAGAEGPGLCEGCHRETDHFRADGGGTEHDGTFCGTCHEHDRGFSP